MFAFAFALVLTAADLPALEVGSPPDSAVAILYAFNPPAVHTHATAAGGECVGGVCGSGLVRSLARGLAGRFADRPKLLRRTRFADGDGRPLRKAR